MDSLRLTIYSEPIPKARARTCVRNGRVMSFTPKATADAEADIRNQLMNQKAFYAKGTPLKVNLAFYITKPPSVSKKRIYPVTRPDIDNYVKLVLDALNQYLFEDDSQIIELHATKAYGNPPRIEIEVAEEKATIIEIAAMTQEQEER